MMTSKPQFELDKVVFLICSNRAILMFGSHVQTRLLFRDQKRVSKRNKNVTKCVEYPSQA